MTRKVIQVAVGTNECGSDVYVLADDGTLWNLHEYRGKQEWRSLPALPPTDVDRSTNIRGSR